MHGVQTNKHILDYSRLASRKHNIYKHMQATKPTHAKGKVTFNLKELSTCYLKEEHWI